MQQLIENALNGILRKLFPKKRSDQPFVDVILLYDVTHEQQAAPNPSAMFELYRYAWDSDTRGTFRANTISRYRLNTPVECYVPGWYKSAIQNVKGNIHFRAEQLEEFKSKILKLVTGVVGSTDHAENDPRCEAYRTIASELSIFANGTAREQVMVIHSSLREKSDLYDPSTDEENLLSTAQQKLAKRFKAANSIGDLERVKVLFVYKPLDKMDEMRFLNMVVVYRFILEPIGATVFVQTDSLKYWL